MCIRSSTHPCRVKVYLTPLFWLCLSCMVWVLFPMNLYNLYVVLPSLSILNLMLSIIRSYQCHNESIRKWNKPVLWGARCHKRKTHCNNDNLRAVTICNSRCNFPGMLIFIQDTWKILKVLAICLMGVCMGLCVRGDPYSKEYMELREDHREKHLSL